MAYVVAELRSACNAARRGLWPAPLTSAVFRLIRSTPKIRSKQHVGERHGRG